METIDNTIAIRMAEKLSTLGREQITPRALAWARMAIIDTIGCTLAGVVEPCTTLLMETPGIGEAPGTSLIMGTRRHTAMLDAALLNGTAAHALDYDDVNGHMGGHPSAPLLPAVFAIADEHSLSGVDLITAFVAGYEVIIRLARAVHWEHYNKGWHPTATLGTFGAAAASAKLLGLDVPQTAKALATSASFASGIKANFGTMTKPLHVGHCARNGLLAALLAERGYESNPAALESAQGFFLVFNGEGNFDAKKIFENWAAPLEIEDDANGLKQFPCCGSTHPSIAMMLSLVQEEGIKADDVERIEILTHPNRLPHTDNPDPKGALGGKFSVQYVNARALVGGAVRLAHFEDAAIDDEAVRSVMRRISVAPYPEDHVDAGNDWGAQLTVTLKDNRHLMRRVERMVCRGPKNAMSDEEMFEKFSDCAGRSLDPSQIAPLFERLGSLETVGDINEISRLLEPLGATAKTGTG